MRPTSAAAKLLADESRIEGDERAPIHKSRKEMYSVWQ